MLTFHKIDLRTAPRLWRYYEHCDYALCEYSLGVKLSWGGVFHSMFSEAADCLIIRSRLDGKTVFDYPVPGPNGSVEAALDEIDAYCQEQGLAPAFINVPAQALPLLWQRYPFLQSQNVRLWQDYLYTAEDLQSFAGRRYSGQRNHVNRFRKTYPDYSFRPLTAGDDLTDFWAEFEAEFHKDSTAAVEELKIAKQLCRLAVTKPWFCSGCIQTEGKIVAISIGERCGDTLIIHVEKALYRYQGVYPTMVTEFARHYGQGVTLLNREDDSCDQGLRTSKLQYLPVRMGEKFSLQSQNELAFLPGIPHLQTRRLSLGPLTRADSAAYQALCLDDERNRWWGYDYREDLKGEVTPDYFLKVARQDFRRRQAVNFAIRLDGKFIGEAVLYHFDYKGTAELGCRIVPQAAGAGYGTEAFAAVADWALYRLGLRRLVAKCFHPNEASRRMLSACMRPCGRDENYDYFEKVV